jgi:hypothetical protein
MEEILQEKKIVFFQHSAMVSAQFFASFLSYALIQHGVKFLDSKLLEASLAV